MLQQTQVERVVPKYHEFLDRYPTLEALAGSTPDAVRRLWYPLGYNVRPLNLHGIAREAVASYGGRPPHHAGAPPGNRGTRRSTPGAPRLFSLRRPPPPLDPHPRPGLGGAVPGARRPAGPRWRSRGTRAWRATWPAWWRPRGASGAAWISWSTRRRCACSPR